ncbi:MAG: hypothetical protein J5728_00935, partial [Lachnospiraceae bacterium]|nr:hypothetical protein [Lachnospiraceae bacterium]
MSQLKYDNLNEHDKKLLLLKVLGVSDDRIVQLQNGDIFLSDVLAERIRDVMNNPEDTTQCA